MRPVAIVLAAGRGERFGGRKLLAPFHGRPLITFLLDTLRTVGELRVVVVIREGDLGLEREVAGAEVTFVPAGPQSASIVAGVGAAGEAPSYLVLLADQPLVDRASIASVLEAWRNGAKAVLMDGGAGPQPPAVFDASLRGRLLALRGDIGAKAVALEAGAGLFVVRREGGLWMEDIDTPEDLERLERLTSTPRGLP